MSRLATPIRKNDNVLVVTGKDRGKRGRVLRVVPDKNRLVVEGVNIIKRHTKPNPGRNIKGGIVEREGSLHASNVQLVCMRLLVFLPEKNVPRKAEFGEWLAHQRLELAAKRRAVESCGLFRLVAVHRLALHEQTLDAVERRSKAVLIAQRLHFLLYAEQPGDERLDMRRQREQERGFLQRRQRVGASPRSRELLSQPGIVLRQRVQEQPVQAFQALTGVKIGEGEARSRYRDSGGQNI